MADVVTFAMLSLPLKLAVIFVWALALTVAVPAGLFIFFTLVSMFRFRG